MLKLFTTLARGALAEVEGAVFDANAIRVLDQQLRQAAGALEQSRRELACAMAYQASEERAIAMLGDRIGELEARRMANRLDEARAEKLLMEVGRAG
jgi:phage shock protein A